MADETAQTAAQQPAHDSQDESAHKKEESKDGGKKENCGLDGSPQDDEHNGHAHGKVGAVKEKLTAKEQKLHDKNNPPGGYDKTLIPTARDGYTVRFTIHRAESLPVSDLASRSSDPFVTATLTSDLPKRHKEDPEMVLRTRTIHKSVDPEWNTEWIVAGVPSSGFRLKCRIYDEDFVSYPSDGHAGGSYQRISSLEACTMGRISQQVNNKSRSR